MIVSTRIKKFSQCTRRGIRNLAIISFLLSIYKDLVIKSRQTNIDKEDIFLSYIFFFLKKKVEIHSNIIIKYIYFIFISCLSNQTYFYILCIFFFSITPSIQGRKETFPFLFVRLCMLLIKG